MRSRDSKGSFIIKNSEKAEKKSKSKEIEEEIVKVDLCKRNKYIRTNGLKY